MAALPPLSCSPRMKEEIVYPITCTVATNLLAPVKTEQQILENSMLEDDPNANCDVTAVPKKNAGPRWGPQHKGAQELANLYSKALRFNFGNCFEITGGENATFGQFPFVASVQHIGCDGDTGLQHTCTGTIISPKYVLTAAHCVNKQNNKLRKVIKIVVGLLDIHDGNETYRQESDIESIIIHPNYTTTYEQFGWMSPNDLAIVKLLTPLEFNDVVKSIPLPTKDEELKENDLVQFVGWGQQVCWMKTPARLKTIEYNVINYTTCYNASLELLYNKDYLVTVDEKLNFCTGPLNNGTKVNVGGDSGGPLVKDGIVYGIYSWTFIYYTQAVQHGVFGPSGIYVKLSQYISWIKENVDDL